MGLDGVRWDGVGMRVGLGMGWGGDGVWTWWGRDGMSMRSDGDECGWDGMGVGMGWGWGGGGDGAPPAAPPLCPPGAHDQRARVGPHRGHVGQTGGHPWILCDPKPGAGGGGDL